MTVARLRREMSAGEFAAWLEYTAQSPIDDERTCDLPAATVASTLAAIHAQRGKTPKLADFLPFRRREKRDLTDEEIMTSFLGWARSCGQPGT